MKIINQALEQVPVATLRLHPRNVNQGDVGAIHESIEANGFYGAVIAQRSTGYVLAGNHRLQAAQHAGAAEVPVIWVDVDDTEALRILLADNRTTRLGHDDPQALAELLQEILADAGTLQGTGYDGDALDELLRDLEPKAPEPGAGEPGAVIPERYDVLVECHTEAEQYALLERLTAEGLQCRALLS